MPALFLTGEETTVLDTITTSLGSALSDVSDNAMSVIASVLPYALAIVGAVLVVTIGIKVFKRIAGR